MCGSKTSLTRCILTAALIVSASLATSNALAGIIIDDFVDDLRIDFPQDNGVRFQSDSIGDLGITRIISTAGVQTRPIGFLDINQTRPSAMMVEIPATTHTGSTPAAWVLLVYELAPLTGGVDLTQGGKNDAVVLDFDRLTADITLYRTYVLATRYRQMGSINASSSYISAYSPVPQSAEPFSLVFPFDSFQLARGAPIPDFDFSFIRELHVLVELALFDPEMPEQLGFEMALTQLRVGRVVPEPCSGATFCVLSVALCFARIRNSYQ